MQHTNKVTAHGFMDFGPQGGLAKDRLNIKPADLQALGYNPNVFTPLTCGTNGCAVICERLDDKKLVVVKFSIAPLFTQSMVAGSMRSPEYDSCLFASMHGIGPVVTLNKKVGKKTYKFPAALDAVDIMEMEFGGTPLAKVPGYRSSEDLIKLAAVCCRLGFVHGDLYTFSVGQCPNNIVYNQITKKYCLIDFGMAVLPTKKNYARNRTVAIAEWLRLFDDDAAGVYKPNVFNKGTITRDVFKTTLEAGANYQERLIPNPNLTPPLLVQQAPKKQVTFAPKNITHYLAAPSEHDDDEAAAIAKQQKLMQDMLKAKLDANAQAKAAKEAADKVAEAAEQQKIAAVAAEEQMQLATQQAIEQQKAAKSKAEQKKAAQAYKAQQAALIETQALLDEVAKNRAAVEKTLAEERTALDAAKKARQYIDNLLAQEQVMHTAAVAQLDELKEMRAGMERSAAALEKNLDDKEKYINKLEEYTGKAYEEQKKAQARYQAEREKVVRLREGLDLVHADVVRYEKEIADLERNKAELAAKKAALADIERIDTELDTLYAQRAGAVKAIVNEQDELRRMDEELRRYRQVARDKVVDVENAIRILSEEREKLRVGLEDAEAEARELQAITDEIKDEIELLQARRGALETDREGAQVEIGVLYAEIAKRRQEAAGLEQTLRNANTEIDATAERLAKTRREVAKLEGTLKLEQTVLKFKKAAVADIVQQQQAQDYEIRKKDAEVEAVAKKLEEVTRTTEQAKKVIFSKQTEVEVARKEAEAKQKKALAEMARIEEQVKQETVKRIRAEESLAEVKKAREGLLSAVEAKKRDAIAEANAALSQAEAKKQAARSAAERELAEFEERQMQAFSAQIKQKAAEIDAAVAQAEQQKLDAIQANVNRTAVVFAAEPDVAPAVVPVAAPAAAPALASVAVPVPAAEVIPEAEASVVAAAEKESLVSVAYTEARQALEDAALALNATEEAVMELAAAEDEAEEGELSDKLDAAIAAENAAMTALRAAANNLAVRRAASGGKAAGKPLQPLPNVRNLPVERRQEFIDRAANVIDPDVVIVDPNGNGGGKVRVNTGVSPGGLPCISIVINNANGGKADAETKPSEAKTEAETVPPAPAKKPAPKLPPKPAAKPTATPEPKPEPKLPPKTPGAILKKKKAVTIADEPLADQIGEVYAAAAEKEEAIKKAALQEAEKATAVADAALEKLEKNAERIAVHVDEQVAAKRKRELAEYEAGLTTWGRVQDYFKSFVEGPEPDPPPTRGNIKEAARVARARVAAVRQQMKAAETVV